MNDYGKAAIKAVELCINHLVKSPQEAWKKSTNELFGHETASQKKGCPKNVFLGLCEEGFIKGIPQGKYTRSIKNKKYAIAAVEIIKNNPSFAKNPKDLWQKIMNGEKKVHNHQMDVVISLWEQGLIII